MDVMEDAVVVKNFNCAIHRNDHHMRRIRAPLLIQHKRSSYRFHLLPTYSGQRYDCILNAIVVAYQQSLVNVVESAAHINILYHDDLLSCRRAAIENNGALNGASLLSGNSVWAGLCNREILFCPTSGKHYSQHKREQRLSWE